MLPRRATAEEIYRYYEVKKYMGDDGRGGAARVTMEGGCCLFLEHAMEVTFLRGQAT